MTILTIRQDGDPVLRQVAESCYTADPRIRQLAADMIETLHAARGIGLAAPQVGQSVRLIVLTYGKRGSNLALVNPKIVKSKGSRLSLEACLSVAEGNKTCRIQRAETVWVEYDCMATDDRLTLKLRGIMAVAAQHEIDHLDGKLITDY